MQKDKILNHGSKNHYYDLKVVLSKEERTGDAYLTTPISKASLFIGRSVLIKKKLKETKVITNPIPMYPEGDTPVNNQAPFITYTPLLVPEDDIKFI